MATTDYEIEAQYKLAEFSYELKEKYGLTMGQTKDQYLEMYQAGEITLSTVYENLFVEMCNSRGIPVKKVSEHCRDFCENAENGDMKIGVLKKDGAKRRYVVSNVSNKIGPIYFVGWNWITNSADFYKIPKEVYGSPKAGIKIMRCKVTGGKTGGRYNEIGHVETFEDLAPEPKIV